MIVEHCITDLRSLRAVAKILKRQDPEVHRIVLSPTLHNKLVHELAEELNWTYQIDTLRWCMSAEGLWVEGRY